MSGIKDTPFNGQTVVYGTNSGTTIRNRIQLGGSDGFPGVTPPEFNLSSEPFYDDSGRTVIYNRNTLVVRFFVISATDAGPRASIQDQRIEELKRVLSLENQNLEIDGLGLGSLVSLKDLVWGPKPRALQISPAGGAGATQVTWTVDFHTKRCNSKIASSNPKANYLAFNWSNTFDLDDEGLLTHISSGYWQIPQNEVSKPVGSATVSDELRESLTNVIKIPRGFRRIRKTFRENAAKDRTDFVIIDQQWEDSAWPPGISEASGTYTFSSSQPGWQKQTATLSMTLKTQKGVPKSVGGLFFLRAAALKAQQLREQGNKSDETTKSAVLPTSFSFTENLWSRTSSYSMSFVVTNTLAELLAFSQMYRPLGDQTGTFEDFETWQAARNTGNLALDSNIGFSKLVEDASEDEIINLCSSDSAPGIFNSLKFGGGDNQEFPNFVMGCPDVKAENSWLAADERITLMENRDNAFSIKKAIKNTVDFINLIPGFGNIPVQLRTTAITTAPVSEGGIDYESAGVPQTILLHQFMGMRVKFAWQFPTIKEYGGKELIDLGSVVYENQRVYCIMGCPVSFGRGYRIYGVDGNISEIEAPVGPTTKCADPIDPDADP